MTETATYLETLNPEQRRAVEHGAAGGLAAAPLLVIAGAGSGKTNTLAHRVAHLIVQGADPDEADLPPMTVVAPQGDFALWAAIDIMRSESARHWNGLELATQHLYGCSFDDGVQHERAAGMPLAIGAMTAVHAHWLVQKLVAYLAAGATADELFSRSLSALFHVPEQI